MRDSVYFKSSWQLCYFILYVSVAIYPSSQCIDLQCWQKEKNAYLKDKSYIFWEHGLFFSKETMTKEIKEIFIINSNPDVGSHGKRKEEKESDQKAGETRTLWMFTDLYIMHYIKNMHYCMI